MKEDKDLEDEVSEGEYLEDEYLEEATEKVAIDVTRLHLVTPAEAMLVFDSLLGSGMTWNSPLMQYRTTSDWQADWKVEVGNWLVRARQLGFLDHLLRNIIPQQLAPGEREAGDAVHRNATQQLAQAQATHYFVGTGWGFHAWEPRISENRSSGIRADVDLQLVAPTGQIVDWQVKASGQLGLHDNKVDEHVRRGVQKAATQLPVPATRPALIAMLAQRDWPLSADIRVLCSLIGSTSQYPDGTVLLHDSALGEFVNWPHISGIVVLDLRRGPADADYGCVLIQNPWADYAVDPACFPHARVLTYSDGCFTWLRGRPPTSTFPTGTRRYSGTVSDALRLHGERRRQSAPDQD